MSVQEQGIVQARPGISGDQAGQFLSPGISGAVPERGILTGSEAVIFDPVVHNHFDLSLVSDLTSPENGLIIAVSVPVNLHQKLIAGIMKIFILQ